MNRARTPLLDRINHMIRTNTLPPRFSPADARSPASVQDEMCEECGEQRKRVGKLCIDCYYKAADYPKCDNCQRPILSCRCP